MGADPRGILIVHDDRSEKVARFVMGEFLGKGIAVQHRNIRYGYHPSMYEMILVIGVEKAKVTDNTFVFEYTPYREYLRMTGKRKSSDKRKQMSLRKYQIKQAEKIAGEISDYL